MSNYVYGTKPPTSEMPEINIIRGFAQRYLEGEEDGILITPHAFQQSGIRRIPLRKAIEVISNDYFVEYQRVPINSNKLDCTVFYSGHTDEVCSVNTVKDIGRNLIILVTVENMDRDVWNITGDYITRKEIES